jgi:selenide,water dikinase
VGFETSDDASVYKLSDEIAMINTVDFITPPVDDPYWYGQIAAANSISDVYSMGGKPLTALNIVMYPSKTLDVGILKEILRGGYDKASEAGVCLVGGHSVEDVEPKYGLCVNGIVHPERIVRNVGVKIGDALILTKPIGSGVLFNAVRAGKLPYKEIERLALPTLAALNGSAMEAALQFELHAATDVTGFGILGHILEMAVGSGTRIALKYDSLPVYPYSLEMYEKGVTTGSNKPNREMALPYLEIARSLTAAQEELLFDPQTSGGLLLAVPALEAKQLAGEIINRGVSVAAIIAEAVEGKPGIVAR